MLEVEPQASIFWIHIKSHAKIYLEEKIIIPKELARISSENGVLCYTQKACFLLCSDRVITIQLDENSPIEMKLGPLTEGRTINISNLYIGGLPEDKGTPMLRMRTSFHGCIKNVVLDAQ